MQVISLTPHAYEITLTVNGEKRYRCYECLDKRFYETEDGYEKPCPFCNEPDYN